MTRKTWCLTLTTADTIDLRVAAGRVVGHEFQPRDPHNSGLLFAPTARSLRAGEGYVGVYEAMLPLVQVGTFEGPDGIP